MSSERDPIDPALRIGSVRLAVGELARSVDFYERVLGLALTSHEANGARPSAQSEENTARLGLQGERPALVLSEINDPTPLLPRSTGLFHVAWLHPTRAALATTVRRIASAGWPIDGASDHGVSEAFYLSDPDGLGIEIYADRPREQWKRPADGNGFEIVTLPLDVEDLLAQAPGEPGPAMNADTHIGHVHLKVADVTRAAAFYRDALGFAEQTRLPSAAFLAADAYHHHVGLNSWQSQGASAAPDDAPGLRRVEFELSGADALDALERRLAGAAVDCPVEREADGSISLRDPDGQLLTFHSN
jgi:catechol 2,3-dioxygenase